MGKHHPPLGQLYVPYDEEAEACCRPHWKPPKMRSCGLGRLTWPEPVRRADLLVSEAHIDALRGFAQT